MVSYPRLHWAQPTDTLCLYCVWRLGCHPRRRTVGLREVAFNGHLRLVRIHCQQNQKDDVKVRTVAELGYDVSPDVLFTIKVLTSRYGAGQPHDSGHTKVPPTWIYTLPGHGNAQVGVRMNKSSLTLYLRDRTLDGRYLSELIPAIKIVKRYPQDGKPAASVSKSSFLRPTNDEHLLMVNLFRSDVESTLALYLGAAHGEAAVAIAGGVVHAGSTGTQPNASPSRVLSAEAFQACLDRRSEVGAMGEGVAVMFELERLRQCGCADPEQYVERVALTDVGRGYDIASTWPCEERYIEVKTSSRVGSDFYISQNELEVLRRLAGKAWIYRVWLDGPEQPLVQAIGPDPISTMSPASELFMPVVWRVSDKLFAQEE